MIVGGHHRSRRPVFGVVGWKKSGKTTLTVALVREFTNRGLRVGTAKHAHHSFSVDDGDTDSARHRRAGAGQVAIASSTRWAVITELSEPAEPCLETVLSKLEPADIVLVEGFKRAAIPKIEARRREAHETAFLAPGDPYVVAIASDVVTETNGLPRFSLDDTAAIADFIAHYLQLPVPSKGT